MTSQKKCHPCEGKGYTEIRDCSGDIQRTERCSFCEGLGYLEILEAPAELKSKNLNNSLENC
jgi:DnaJ-class molecular chaperone